MAEYMYEEEEKEEKREEEEGGREGVGVDVAEERQVLGY